DTSDPESCATPFEAKLYNYFDNCPPTGTVIERSTTTNAHTDPSISLLWSPIDGVTLRGSYTTGYLPPQLSQLVKVPRTQITLQMRDP
ncbi:TonB-dependent receptor, partial [Acinetobacter baumannii]|nr:TonB-dependent receptor [Acinetobacter baumannii]